MKHPTVGKTKTCPWQEGTLKFNQLSRLDIQQNHEKKADSHCGATSTCNCLRKSDRQNKQLCHGTMKTAHYSTASFICSYAQLPVRNWEELTACGVKWGSAGNKQITVPPRWCYQYSAQEGTGLGASLTFSDASTLMYAHTHSQTNLTSTDSSCLYVSLPNCFMFLERLNKTWRQTNPPGTQRQRKY